MTLFQLSVYSRHHNYVDVAYIIVFLYNLGNSVHYIELFIYNCITCSLTIVWKCQNKDTYQLLYSHMHCTFVIQSRFHVYVCSLYAYSN